MKTWALTAVLATLLLSRCATAPAGSAAPAASPSALASLSASQVADTLRRSGASVDDAGMVEQPFFPVPAHVYAVDGGDLQIYEFATPSEAAAAASQVSSDGSTIGAMRVTWLAPPHFFRKNRLVVNYIGTSAAVLAELQRLFGPQFAAR